MYKYRARKTDSLYHADYWVIERRRFLWIWEFISSMPQDTPEEDVQSRVTFCQKNQTEPPRPWFKRAPTKIYAKVDFLDHIL
jgi:hypothetical protein